MCAIFTSRRRVVIAAVDASTTRRRRRHRILHAHARGAQRIARAEQRAAERHVIAAAAPVLDVSLGAHRRTKQRTRRCRVLLLLLPLRMLLRLRSAAHDDDGAARHDAGLFGR